MTSSVSSSSNPLDPIQSYHEKVENQLDSLCRENGEDLEKIKQVLNGFLNPEITVEREMPEWLLELRDQSQQFTDDQQRKECQSYLMNEVALKILEIETTERSLKESQYAPLIDQTLNAFPLESLDHFTVISYYLMAAIINLDPSVEAHYPPFVVDRALLSLDHGAFNEAAVALERLLKNETKDGEGNVRPLIADAEGVNRFRALLFTKIQAKIEELNGYSEAQKEERIDSYLYHKEEGNYIELINGHLDSFPLETLEDFESNREILEKIINSEEIPLNISTQLKDKVRSLGDLLLEPELFVHPNHIERFKELVQLRIKKTIEEIKQLTPAQKEKRLADYKVNQDEKRVNQAIIAAHPGPNANQRTISYEEMLINMEREGGEEREGNQNHVQRATSAIFSFIRTLQATVNSFRMAEVITVVRVHSNEAEVSGATRVNRFALRILEGMVSLFRNN